MPNYNFDDEAQKPTTTTNTPIDTIDDDKTQEYIGNSTDDLSNGNTIDNTITTQNPAGMSDAEVNDANIIKVTIADQRTPIVVLFGPPTCGKTMTMIRLARYLKSKGYSISPVTSFRPSTDTHYKDMCDQFDQMVYSEKAAEGTDRINFMLVKVSKNGRPICQILEAPGEHYFDPKNPKAQFPKYISNIINCNNRKIWAIVVESDNTAGMDDVQRKQYATKIEQLKKKMHPRDRVIFVVNKIDTTDFVISPGKVHTGQAYNEIGNLYPNIFLPFKNQIPIISWFKENNFDFIPFQTGDFPVASNGTKTFEQGPDAYPRNLWNVILKRVRG